MRLLQETGADHFGVDLCGDGQHGIRRVEASSGGSRASKATPLMEPVLLAAAPRRAGCLRRDGEPDGERRATARRAGNRHRSAESLDTVREAEDAGAAAGIDATDAIIAYLQCQDPLLARGVQLDDVR